MQIQLRGQTTLPAIQAPVRASAPQAADSVHFGNQGQLNQQLIRAVGQKNEGEVRRLLKQGADANTEIRSAAGGMMGEQRIPIVMVAVETPFKRGILEALIEHGADIKAKNQNGLDALYVATQFGEGEALQLLIDTLKKSLQTAEVKSELTKTYQFNGTWTLESLAQANGHPHIVRILQEAV